MEKNQYKLPAWHYASITAKKKRIEEILKEIKKIKEKKK